MLHPFAAFNRYEDKAIEPNGTKSMVSLIVAYDENRLIGSKGVLPWSIKEDMLHFKKMTWGCPVIMGRRTFNSIPEKFRPLPKRTNFVLTRTPSKSQYDRTFFMNSMETAIDLARHTDPNKTVWVIGGSEIYKMALDEGWVDRIVASEVKGKHDGDAFFPEVSDKDWERVPVSSNDLFDIAWYVRRT